MTIAQNDPAPELLGWTTVCEQRVPILACRRVEYGGRVARWRVPCPFCGLTHEHSAGEGARSIHCPPYIANALPFNLYVLRPRARNELSAEQELELRAELARWQQSIYGLGRAWMMIERLLAMLDVLRGDLKALRDSDR